MTPESRNAQARKLATECFGSAAAAAELINIISNSSRMKAGAGAFGRPRTRRDKLTAAAKAGRRLLHHMDGIDPFTRARIFAPPKTPQTAVTFTAEERAAIPDLPTGPVHQSWAGGAIELFDALRQLAGLFADRVEELAKGEIGTGAGAPSVPDAAMFAVEGLAYLWKRQRGAPPDMASRKRGGFGYLVEETLALDPAFSREEARTALRRYVEGLDSR